MLLEAVPQAYLNTIADPLTCFAGVCARTMLAHLDKNYATITTDHVEANEQELSRPWDPATPTETVFDHATEVQAFAATTTDTISDGKLVRETLQIFKKSGVLGDGVKDWRKKLPADQTWTAMRVHFRKANQRRIQDSTSGDLGYHAANAAQTGPTNAAAIQAMVTQAVAAQTNNNTTGATDLPNWYYCWSHGLGINPNHTSSTCTHAAEGHNSTATLGNMKGVNNKIRRGRNEQSIYQFVPRNNNNNNNNGPT